MAIPPSDSGLRASAAVAAGLTDDQLSGSWRKKLRWWRWRLAAYTRAYVLANAGITAGVTPGYTGSPGVTATARTNRSGAVNAVWTITHRYTADGVNSAQAISTSGAGTEADPYIVENWHLYGYTLANGDVTAAATWDHDAATYPAESYWIKFRNIQWGVGSVNKSGNAYINAPTGGGAIFEYCTFDDSGGEDAGRTLGIEAVRGTTRLLYCHLSRAFGSFVKKTGANAIVEATDCLINRSAGPWNNSLPIFWNAATGGSLTLWRVSHDVQANNPFIRSQYDWSVTIDGLDFNTSDNGDVQTVIPTGTSYLSEPWTSGFTMTDSIIRTGKESVSPIGENVTNNNVGIANWLIDHCDIRCSDTVTNATTLTANALPGATTITVASISGYASGNAMRTALDGGGYEYNSVSLSVAPAGNTITLQMPMVGTATSGNAVAEMRMGSARLIALGIGNTVDPESTKNITISWTRLRRPYGGVAAGCETMEFWRSSDVTVEYCWIDQCGEDAYEFVQPFRNNVIRYCGGGGVSGSYIGGNVHDFYAGFAGSGGSYTWGAADGNTGGHQAHHIWGTCGGDALIVDSVQGVTIHSIDVTNVVGSTPGFVQNPPAANVRLHWRSTGTLSSLDGVTVSGSLTSVANSFNGEPCLLTYESAAAETYADSVVGTSTLSWVNGKDATVRLCNDATAIVDAM